MNGPKFDVGRRAGELLFSLQQKLPRAKRIAALDIESKEGIDPEKAGFARPFLVCVAPPLGDSFDRSPSGRRNKSKNASERPTLAFSDSPDIIARRASLLGADGAYNGNGETGSAIDRALTYILQDSEWLYSSRDEVVVYAHNGGKFDLLHLWQWFDRQGRDELYTREPMTAGSRMIEMRVCERMRFVSNNEALEINRRLRLHETTNFRDSLRAFDPHRDKCDPDKLPTTFVAGGATRDRNKCEQCCACTPKRRARCKGCRPVVALSTLKTATERPRETPREWLFRDSVAVLALPLKRAAEAFLPAHEQKIALPLDTPENDARWIEYCVRDAEALRGVLTAYAKQLGALGGTLEITAAATAMKLYRRQYLSRLRGTRGVATFKKRTAIERGQHFKECPAVCKGCGRATCAVWCAGDYLYAREALDRMRATNGRTAQARANMIDLAIRSHDTRWLRRRDKADANAEAKKCPTYPIGCAHSWIYGGAEHDQETSALHGGRSELFCRRWSRYDLSYFDVNSSYPFAMTKPVPIGAPSFYGPERFASGDPWTALESIARRGENDVHDPAVFVDCEVEIPDSCEFPPLGIIRRAGSRSPASGKYIFPVGRFWGRFAWCELRHVSEVGGRVVNVRGAVKFRAAPILAAFAGELYEARRAAKAAVASGDTKRRGEDATIKLLLNAGGFGKWAQACVREQIIPARPWSKTELRDGVPGHVDDESVTPITTSDGFPSPWSNRKVYTESSFFIPQIASWITALAREHLWTCYRDVERAGGRVVYSDTDSLLVDPKGARALAHRVGSQLGQLKIEHEGFAFEGLAPKEYLLKWGDGRRVARMKGLPVPSEEFGPEATEGMYRDWENGEPVTLRPQLARFRQMLSEGGQLVTNTDRAKKRSTSREDKRVFPKLAKHAERSSPHVMAERSATREPAFVPPRELPELPELPEVKTLWSD